VISKGNGIRHERFVADLQRNSLGSNKLTRREFGQFPASRLTSRCACDVVDGIISFKGIFRIWSAEESGFGAGKGATSCRDFGERMAT
jgi:hypothetical protein